MSPTRKAQALVAIALAAAVALPGVYLAAGGSSYAPAKVADPCQTRPWRDPEGLDQIAEQFSLSALDGAACELGVSREALARALATGCCAPSTTPKPPAPSARSSPTPCANRCAASRSTRRSNW